MSSNHQQTTTTTITTPWDFVMNKLLHKLQHPHDPTVPPVNVVVFGGSVPEGRDCLKLPPELQVTVDQADASTSKRIVGRICSYPNRWQALLDMALGNGGTDGGNNNNIVVVHNVAVGGTNSWLSMPIIQHMLYREDSPLSSSDHPHQSVDVIINAYATNDNLPQWNRPKNTTVDRYHTDGSYHKIQAFLQACRNSIPCPTSTTSSSLPSQQQQQPLPLVLYMDDYVGNQANVLLGEMQVHDVTMELGRLSNGITLGHVSTMNALWRSFILPRTNETLLSPPWRSTVNKKGEFPVEVHFGMSGHVARTWILAYAVLQWTVDYCHDQTIKEKVEKGVENEKEKKAGDEMTETTTKAGDEMTENKTTTTGTTTHSTSRYYYDRQHQRIRQREAATTTTTTTTLFSTTPPLPRKRQKKFRFRSSQRTNTATTATAAATAGISTLDLIHTWEPLPLHLDMRLQNVTNVWKHAMIARHAITVQQCGDMDHEQNTTTSSSSSQSPQSQLYQQQQRQRPCPFAFVAAPMGTHSSATDLNKYISRFGGIVAHDSWRAEDDIKNGWQNKLGFVAKKNGARIAIQLPTSSATATTTPLTTPIRVITLHYLKSYGEKWENSTANFTFTIIRQRPSLSSETTMSSPSTSLQEPSSTTADDTALFDDDKDYKTSWQLTGYHDQKSSVSYPFSMDLGRTHQAQPGDSVTLEIELVGGETFKILSLLLCNH